MTGPSRPVQTFRDVATAAYCPRKLYYRRRQSEPPEIPPEVRDLRSLACQYETILAGETRLDDKPITVTPTQYRSRLGQARARLDAWDRLVDPTRRDALLSGRDCRGRAHKVLAGPSVSLAFAGDPPEQGVWAPQSVHLVAAAKALAWERETAIERAFAEYPAHGVVREVALGTRRKARYREALRVAESIDGPPPRVDSDAKCTPCEFSEECGTRTRSLRSMLAE